MKKDGKKFGILCGAVILVLLAVIVVLLQRQKTPQEAAGEAGPKRNVVVTESNAEETAARMAAEDFVEPGYYTVNMATEWHFETWDAISPNARVDNVAGNTNPVYFDVFLAGSEEEPIYQSPVIPVGSFLENIALEHPLEKGAYDCVMVYHLVDEEQETVSTLRVAIQIVVEG